MSPFLEGRFLPATAQAGLPNGVPGGETISVVTGVAADQNCTSRLIPRMGASRLNTVAPRPPERKNGWQSTYESMFILQDDPAFRRLIAQAGFSTPPYFHLRPPGLRIRVTLCGQVFDSPNLRRNDTAWPTMTRAHLTLRAKAARVPIPAARVNPPQRVRARRGPSKAANLLRPATTRNRLRQARVRPAMTRATSLWRTMKATATARRRPTAVTAQAQSRAAAPAATVRVLPVPAAPRPTIALRAHKRYSRRARTTSPAP